MGMWIIFFEIDMNRPTNMMLEGGPTSSLLRLTVNLGVRQNVSRDLKILQKHQPNGPLFVTEYIETDGLVILYWINILTESWLDHWGEEHHTVSAEIAEKTLELFS